MHIAVCISGEMRALIENWPSLMRYLEKPGRSYEVFLHTWAQKSTGRVSRLFDRHMGRRWKPLVYSNEVTLDILKPKAYLIEENTTDLVDNMKDLPPYTDGRHRVQSMWKGWFEASRLALYNFSPVKPFDLVCRLRSDLQFNSDPFLLFENFLPPRNYVFVPQFHNGGDPELSYKVGLHDFFGVAELKTFLRFTSLYEHAYHYIPLHPDGFFPEIILKSHCDHMGISIIRYPVEYEIIRI